MQSTPWINFMRQTFKTPSEQYTNMFPEEYMEQHFGNDTPGALQRAMKFQDLWSEWSHNEMLAPKQLSQASVHKILSPYMKSLFEWQIKPELREDDNKCTPGVDVWDTSTNRKKFMSKVLVIRCADSDLLAMAKILLS